jgi:hypothetical protein
MTRQSVLGDCGAFMACTTAKVTSVALILYRRLLIGTAELFDRSMTAASDVDDVFSPVLLAIGRTVMSGLA